MILAQTFLVKFHQKLSFSTAFFQDNFRLKVVNDVISGVVVDRTSVKVREEFSDSRSNRSRDIDCLKCVTNSHDHNDAGYHMRVKC